jgi:hypothetical protein
MMHRFGDPGHTMGDHRVGAVRVTSHDDGVVDVRPGAGPDVIAGTLGRAVKH